MLRSLILAVFCLQGWSSVAVAVERRVEPGNSIQRIIDDALDGDTIFVNPGVYRESLHVDKKNLKIIGVIKNGEWPTLEGDNRLNDGIVGSGSGMQIENLKIQNYKANGVTTQAANNVTIRHLIVENTGIYGIYPTLSSNVLIEDSVASDIADAGIYVGMCTHVDVRRNTLYDNVAGIESENSEHILIEDNVAYDNTVGLLVFVLPGLPRKIGQDDIVRHNFLYSNNHHNFGATGAVISTVPPGSGVIVLAADKVVFEDNVIHDNSTAGIIFADLDGMPSLAKDPEVDPLPDHNAVLRNLIYANGHKSVGDYFAWIRFLLKTALGGTTPDKATEHIMPPKADIFSTGKGRSNCLAANNGWVQVDVKDFETCPADQTTASIKTMLSSNAGDAVSFGSAGEKVFQTICAGCHAYSYRLIGPPIKEIQAKYANNWQGIVAYASSPVRVRSGYPTMPTQKYLGEEKLQAVARTMLDRRQ